MQKQINRFTDFMSWLLKQYRDILEYTARNYPFRIVDGYRVLRTGETIFTILSVGNRTPIKLTAAELAEDDDLIQGFSPKDVKRIMQAALTKSKIAVIHGGLQQTPYKILAKNFERDAAKLSYIIEQTNAYNEKITKTFTLDEVTKSKEILLQFSKHDIYEIAYTAGINSILSAQEDIEKIKN